MGDTIQKKVEFSLKIKIQPELFVENRKYATNAKYIFRKSECVLLASFGRVIKAILLSLA